MKLLNDKEFVFKNLGDFLIAVITIFVLLFAAFTLEKANETLLVAEKTFLSSRELILEAEIISSKVESHSTNLQFINNSAFNIESVDINSYPLTLHKNKDGEYKVCGTESGKFFDRSITNPQLTNLNLVSKERFTIPIDLKPKIEFRRKIEKQTNISEVYAIFKINIQGIRSDINEKVEKDFIYFVDNYGDDREPYYVIENLDQNNANNLLPATRSDLDKNVIIPLSESSKVIDLLRSYDPNKVYINVNCS